MDSLQESVRQHVEQHGADHSFHYSGTQYAGCGRFEDEDSSASDEPAASVLSLMATEVYRVVKHLLQSGDTGSDDAQRILNLMLTTPNRGTAKGVSVYSKNRPRRMSETYSTKLKFDAIGERLHLDSKWLWLSERCHDAHISESKTMKIRRGAAVDVIVEYKSFEKPDHERFGGGRLKQARLVVHWDKAAALASAIGLSSPTTALLFACCLGLHRGTQEKRTNLLNIVLAHEAELREAKEGDTSTEQVIVLDDHGGAPIVADTMIEDDFVDCFPPTMTPMTIERNLANAEAISHWH